MKKDLYIVETTIPIVGSIQNKLKEFLMVKKGNVYSKFKNVTFNHRYLLFQVQSCTLDPNPEFNELVMIRSCLEKNGYRIVRFETIEPKYEYRLLVKKGQESEIIYKDNSPSLSIFISTFKEKFSQMNSMLKTLEIHQIIWEIVTPYGKLAKQRIEFTQPLTLQNCISNDLDLFEFV